MARKQKRDTEAEEGAAFFDGEEAPKEVVAPAAQVAEPVAVAPEMVPAVPVEMQVSKGAVLALADAFCARFGDGSTPSLSDLRSFRAQLAALE